VPLEDPLDVLVVGGGSSGIAAAVAAARVGAKTALVERYGHPGGTSTAGLVGPFMTAWSADGKQQIIAGIFQEMIDRMLRVGGAVDPATTRAGSAHASYIEYGHAHVTPFNAEALKLCALEMLHEAGVDLRLHTWFIDATMNGKRIDNIIIADKAGLHALVADVFVDASADGDLSARAGAQFTIGRSDGRMMPATVFFRVGGVDDARIDAWIDEHRALHPGERLFECLVQQAKLAGEWSVPREYVNIYREPQPGVYRVNTSRIHDIDGTNPRDLSRAELVGRRQVGELMRFFRARCPGFEKAQLLETAAQVGIRETRHIIGEYVLTADDVLNGRCFDDAIARCAYPIDIHDPTGTRGSLQGPQDGGHNWYEIPYRCLLPKGIDNLLVAGRCISATHEAAGSARVIPACYATGQAAGSAAAMSIGRHCTPREIPPCDLRDCCKREGAIL
jgi:hypothetical protein